MAAAISLPRDTATLPRYSAEKPTDAESAAMDLEEERRSRGEEKTPKDNRFCPKTDWPFKGLRQRPLPEGGAVGGRTACVSGCVGALLLGPLTTRRGVASFLLGTFLLLSTLFLCQFWKISQLFWKSNENFCRVH